jgi:tripartite-type tricarboxylate transporter receptor subunit TctC
MLVPLVGNRAREGKPRPSGRRGNIGTHAQVQALYKNPPYNAAIDFAPVALLYESSTVLAVRKDLPASNLREFIAYAKANQSRMQYGSPGAGNPAHLACALFNAARNQCHPCALSRRWTRHAGFDRWPH